MSESAHSCTLTNQHAQTPHQGGSAQTTNASVKFSCRSHPAHGNFSFPLRDDGASAAGRQRLTKFAIKVERLSCICSSEDAETWRTSPWNLSHGQIPAACALLLCSCSPAGPALRNCSLQAFCTGCALLAGSPSRDHPHLPRPQHIQVWALPPFLQSKSPLA